MEITKINGEEIKIGKTSITVKGDNSKTIGVIRNCTIINNLLAPRILFQISRKLKEKNINLMSLYNRLVAVDGNYYFLYNLRKNDFVEKYAIKNPEGDRIKMLHSGALKSIVLKNDEENKYNSQLMLLCSIRLNKEATWYK